MKFFVDRIDVELIFKRWFTLINRTSLRFAIRASNSALLLEARKLNISMYSKRSSLGPMISIPTPQHLSLDEMSTYNVHWSWASAACLYEVSSVMKSAVAWTLKEVSGLWKTCIKVKFIRTVIWWLGNMVVTSELRLLRSGRAFQYKGTQSQYRSTTY